MTDRKTISSSIKARPSRERLDERMNEYWVTIGLAAVTGTFVSTVVSVWTVSRNIKHKAIIEERQKWRDALRELIPRLVDADRRDERNQRRDSIILRLNPYKDQDAMQIIDQYVENPSRESGLLVVFHFQDLLKQDWERAKIEASLVPLWARSRGDLRVRRQARGAGSQTRSGAFRDQSA